MPQRPHPILRWTPPQSSSSCSTIGILEGEIRCLYKWTWGTHLQANCGLSNTPRICYNKQHTSKNQSNLVFLHKETLGEKSLKSMRGKWRTAWWRCRSRPSPSILQRWASLGGWIERNLRFGEILDARLQWLSMLDELSWWRRRKGV